MLELVVDGGVIVTIFFGIGSRSPASFISPKTEVSALRSRLRPSTSIHSSSQLRRPKAGRVHELVVDDVVIVTSCSDIASSHFPDIRSRLRVQSSMRPSFAICFAGVGLALRFMAGVLGGARHCMWESGGVITNTFTTNAAVATVNITIRSPTPRLQTSPSGGSSSHQSRSQVA